MLYAEPYTFQFARENRYPALSYTPHPPEILNAYDPDEDTLYYSFLPTLSVSDGELIDREI